MNKIMIAFTICIIVGFSTVGFYHERRLTALERKFSDYDHHFGYHPAFPFEGWFECCNGSTHSTTNAPRQNLELMRKTVGWYSAVAGNEGGVKYVEPQ